MEHQQGFIVGSKLVRGPQHPLNGAAGPRPPFRIAGDANCHFVAGLCPHGLAQNLDFHADRGVVRNDDKSAATRLGAANNAGRSAL
ncbi:hypothetical protein SDC9_156530 [bioreactor metagenome]|uniref:Uncharacterized protein n=1 Tax=bioreactor metagenome TaxID=1076179 RepID=A0A645F4P3_9ZZZZ